jgi:hypothetical protein
MIRTRVVTAIALALLLGPIGCGNKSPQSSDSSQSGGSSSSNSTQQPAAPPAPAAQPQAPPPPPPIVIPAGTAVTVSLQQAVSSKTSQDGERFQATLAEPLVVGGQVVVPKGTNCYGTVTEAHAAGKFKGAATLKLSLNRIEIGGTPVEIKTSGVAKTSTGKGKRTAGLIGGGAAGGAIIGALAGGGKGAAIGALVGGGAGTAGAAFTGNRDISLPAETVLNFQLTEPITVQQ